ncbi:MAG: anaerobic sulfatase-maturation protein [Bacteroidales bacterium]|nr:anaerobic sulfatase-maturation protein [Bacteroidales bacterium]
MNKTVTFNPLEYPLYVMLKPIGAVCNLNCSYCYYLGKEQMYPNRKNYQMSDELLTKFTQMYIESQPSHEVLFTWHGGETLLRDISFYKKAIQLQHRYGRGKRIQNALQTNGVLLNDDWCRFFKDNDFLIGISIDGPEHIHDHYRKNKGGLGTFRQVMRGIELLQKHGVEFNTMGVIHDYNSKRPLEVYHFLKEIGSRYMQFSPIVERLSARQQLLSVSDPEVGQPGSWNVIPKEFGSFYTTIFDEWVLNDVGTYYIQLFDSTLANMVGVQPGACIYAEECGHATALEFNGDLYACDHYVFEEYKLGNIYKSSLIEMMLSPKQLHFGLDKKRLLPTQCKQCPFLKLCNGECPKNRFDVTADGESGLNYLCEGYRDYYQHVTPYMQFMANELANERPPANVMSWVRGK